MVSRMSQCAKTSAVSDLTHTAYVLRVQHPCSFIQICRATFDPLWSIWLINYTFSRNKPTVLCRTTVYCLWISCLTIHCWAVFDDVRLRAYGAHACYEVLIRSTL